MERYIGKMLDNRYEILEVIGTGGMAVVFKAKCHRLNRLVAIKMLKKDLSEDAEFRRRFHDESQAVAMLSHPNIMAVYDVSRGGDMDYIVMELIDGITLKQYMERRGKLNWPEALHFITQIMKGLSHAHSRGIVHRDIKPQNIMVLRDGTVKVTDFGIACLSNGRSPSNEAIGSVHYISPEQAKGDYTDNRSDIYSAGVVLYEMLTSRLPFDGNDPVSVAIQHFSAVPLAPREIDPEIPEALEQICMKAMATDRNQRYSTADEMLADLDAFRKDPNLSFDYSVEDLQREQSGREEEPTQYIPNVAATRNKQSVRPVQEPDYDEEDDEKPRSNWWKVLLLILAISVGGYFAVTSIYQSILDSFTPAAIPEFTVPDLRGLTVKEASEREDVAGIFAIVEDKYAYSTEYAQGQIISQDPEEGKIKRRPNGKDDIIINVTVSNGARSGEMLYLIGDDVRAARLRLEQWDGLRELNLNIVEGEEEYSDTVEAGFICRTDPVQGTILSEGDTVTLYLSKGPEIIYHTMISCLGESMEWVQQQMNVMGVTAEFHPVEGSAAEGTVLSQSVETGADVAEGSTVVFTYSDGLKLLEQIVTYTVPFSFQDVTVEMYLDSDQVLQAEFSAGYEITQPLYATAGTHELRIYADEELMETRELVFGE